jgi:hypothetical protein
LGKEAKLRKEKRSKALAKWAQENPERFVTEWNKRLDSWLQNIWQSAADSITLTEEQYRAFLCRYPGANCLDILMSRNYEGDHVLCLHRLQEIHRDALGEAAMKELIASVAQGVLRGRRIFSIVDHAKKTLTDCGEAAVALQLRETIDLLSNECCRALAPHIGSEIYTLKKYRRPEEEEANNKRRLKSPSRR